MSSFVIKTIMYLFTRRLSIAVWMTMGPKFYKSLPDLHWSS